MTLLNRATIEEYVKYRKDYGGWTLVAKDKEGARFTVPKGYNPVLFWLGLLTCWIYGLGIIIWIIGLLDYFLSPRDIRYIDIYQMRKELKERDKRWL